MFKITVRLRFGVFDAGSAHDPRQPEWPPHPARVFCALVASDPSDTEWEALRWLEMQAPPEVHAAQEIDRTGHEQYLVNNTVKKGKGQGLPARQAGSRFKPRLVPASGEFHLVWPDATPDDRTVRALEALARRVPYVGRSTSDAEVSVSSGGGTSEADAVLATYEPVPLREGELEMRVPFTGYCDRLRDAHQQGRLAWEESRTVDYRQRIPPASAGPDTIPSPYESSLVFRFSGKSFLHSRHVVAVADRLRAATISIMDEELGSVPPAVSGHGADGVPHVAFLGLPNVGVPDCLPLLPEALSLEAGNVHADGRLLGLALAIPDDESGSLRREIYRSLVRSETGLRELTLGRDGVAQLEHWRGGARPLTLDSRRWAKPSRLWATATPLVLDRYPRRGQVHVDEMVAAALVTAGYPEPVAVHCQRQPFLPGSPSLSRSRVQRRSGAPVRPWYHAWVMFDRPQQGPVIAGSMRYRGLGLFAPLDDSVQLREETL